MSPATYLGTYLDTDRAPHRRSTALGRLDTIFGGTR
jgi:hypothetical protein